MNDIIVWKQKEAKEEDVETTEKHGEYTDGEAVGDERWHFLRWQV